MRKNMTMRVNVTEYTNTISFTKMTINMIISMIAIIRNYYSNVLGYRLNKKQTMLILNAQFAFLFTVFPIECPPILRIICMAWLITALMRCKQSGIRTSD